MPICGRVRFFVLCLASLMERRKRSRLRSTKNKSNLKIKIVLKKLRKNYVQLKIKGKNENVYNSK